MTSAKDEEAHKTAAEMHALQLKLDLASLFTPINCTSTTVTATTFTTISTNFAIAAMVTAAASALKSVNFTCIRLQLLHYRLFYLFPSKIIEDQLKVRT